MDRHNEPIGYRLTALGLRAIHDPRGNQALADQLDACEDDAYGHYSDTCTDDWCVTCEADRWSMHPLCPLATVPDTDYRCPRCADPADHPRYF